MDDKTLTLQKTADRLDVHYMTAYRWVRTGLLPAEKDHGVWRVRAEDADAHLVAEAVPVPDTQPRSRRRVDHGARLADRLLAGDLGGAIRVMEDALRNGVTAKDISLGVITDAMRRVGEAWAAGNATIAEEHQASTIATQLVGRLAPHFTRRGRKRGTIVLGTVADDHHALAVSLLAGPLRGRGHQVIELGANTPPEAFADAVGNEAPVAAIGIFSAFPQDAVVAETVAAVRAAGPDTRIVLGGAGVSRDGRTSDSYGADAITADGPAAVAALIGEPD